MRTKFRPNGAERGNPLLAGGWRHRAACLGADVEVFFSFERIAEAQTWCAACPVRAECAEAGRRERFGVWGGSARSGRRGAAA